MKKCMIFLEHEYLMAGVDLLEVVRQYYSQANLNDSIEGVETYGVLFNHKADMLQGYFDNIIRISQNSFKAYDLKSVTATLEKVCKQYDFDMILIPSTWQGRMLAPRLAIALSTGLTADVTEIRHEKGITQLVRPAYSGRLLAGIVNISKGPIMMTVRQNVFHYQGELSKETFYHDFQAYDPVGNSIREISLQPKEVSFDIRDSSILISGGGGIQKGFDELSKLADMLGGHVAASRRIVDAGIANREIQVGQSGKTVSPKLYMAFGINGAIQHVEGLKNVKYIISVNKNEQAPINSLSDLVVAGDASIFLKKLIERIRDYKEKSS